MLNALKKAEEAEARATAAETKLKESETAAKLAADKKLEEDGEFKTLAENAAIEAKTAKEAKEASDTQLKEANEYAQGTIDAQLEAIEDEGKREIVKKQLEGKTAMQQLQSLPDLMKLAGLEQGATTKPKVGGNGVIINEDGTINDVEHNKEKERFAELREKSQKNMREGGPKLTPAERAELQKLGTSLQKVRNAEKAKEKKEEDDKVTVL